LNLLKQSSVQLLFRYSSSSSSTNYQRWLLFASVCVERKPVISQPLTPMEIKFAAFLDKLELQNSLKSDHELRHEGDMVRSEQLKAGTLDDADLDVVAAQTAQDFEDASQEELLKFNPAPRKTESDLKDDRHSLDRALDRYLMLVINPKFGQNSPWIFPQSEHQLGETLRQTAERTLCQLCGSNLKARILGNAPVGFYKYKFPKHMRGEGKPVGAKVFFYQAQHLAGNVDPTAGTILDYQWMTYSDMQIMMKPNYLHAVSQFLVSDEVPTELSSKAYVHNNTDQVSLKQQSQC